jgi:hypothetical protein
MRAVQHLAKGLVVALLAAACGGGTGEAGSTTTTSTGDTTASSTTTTTMAAPEPVELMLESVPPSTDPLETIEPLDGVTVTTDIDGAVVFTFAESMHGGISIRLLGLPDGQHVACSWYPSDAFAGDGEGTGCFSQTQTGYVGDEPYSNGDAPTMSVVVAMDVTADSITITVGDTAFTGTGLSLEDGPLFVQIDPNTGGLAEPVTKRTGEITAAELFAALGG